MLTSPKPSAWSAVLTATYLTLALLALAVIALPRPHPLGMLTAFYVVYAACIVECSLRTWRHRWLNLTPKEIRKRLDREGAPAGLALEALSLVLSAVAITLQGLR